MKFGVIVAARFNSIRLPGKAMLPLFGLPVISVVIKRIQTSKLIDKIIFATTQQKEDDVLAATILKEGVEIYRGSTNDVLDRYVKAAENHEFDYIIRITGDCPFVDGPTLDHVIKQCCELHPFDLVTTKPAYPHGIDYEIYSKKLMEDINKLDLTTEEREHHLNYIYNNEQKFNILRLKPSVELNYNNTIFLLDTPSDYKQICNLVKGIADIYISPAELIKKHIYAN